MKIPESIELALLKQRKEINKQAELFNRHASPEMSMAVQPEKLVEELDFWNIKNDEKLDSFLLELPYALLLAGPDFDWKNLPEGYYPLAAVIEFELSCQNDGWLAIGNSGEEKMMAIIEAYRFLGVSGEASALSAVLRKYLEIDNENDEFQKLIDEAYNSVKNDTTEFEARLAVIRKFVRENGKMFAANE